MDKKLNRLVIAIDGPAGSGKSTVSKILAKKLDLLYIDTGAMYRAITLKAMRRNTDLSNGEELTRLARQTKIDLKCNNGVLQVLLDGEDVASLIRTNELTNNVKYIARVPGVRAEMVKLQRAIGERQNSVLEGRDIGTVVFPDAPYKFYLDAAVEERACRRHKELCAQSGSPGVDEIKKDIVKRDESDINRDVGALKVSEGAIVIDTTKLSIDGVVEKLLSYIV